MWGHSRDPKISLRKKGQGKHRGRNNPRHPYDRRSRSHTEVCTEPTRWTRADPHHTWCDISVTVSFQKVGGRGTKNPKSARFWISQQQFGKLERYKSILQNCKGKMISSLKLAIQLNHQLCVKVKLKRTGLLQLTSRQCFSRSYCGWAPIPNKAQTGRKGSGSCEKRKAEVPAAQHTEGAPSEAWTAQNRFMGPLHPGALKENGASIPTRSLGELVMKAGSMSDTWGPRPCP